MGDSERKSDQGETKEGIGRGRSKEHKYVNKSQKKSNKKVPINIQEKLTCYYTNADSLLNKRSEFAIAVAHYSPDIICIAEAVPKNTLTKAQESEFQLEGYDLCSNIARCRRGVIMYTAKKLNASPADCVNVDFEESCWIEIGLQGKDKLLVGCVYRSPNSEPSNTSKLLTSLKEVSKLKEYSHLLICGDFNFPDINWIDDLAPDNVNSYGFQFRECLRDCFLTQHVTDYTHRRGDQRPSTIDLILTNEENMIEDLSIEAPLGKSHHATLVFGFMCYTRNNRPNIPRPVYSKGDYPGFRAKLSGFDWENDFVGKSCEECWQLFAARMEDGVRQFVPKSTVMHGKSGRPLWLYTKALEKVKKKREAYKRYINTQEEQDYVAYARIRNQVRWECRKAKRQFERELAKETKSNPKAFYSYTNGKLKTKSGIANLETANGKATTNKEKAEALNEFFVSVFTMEDKAAVPELESPQNIVFPFEDIEISTEDVRERLDKLNVSKSPGPDNMHPHVLKELSPVINTPLATIMQKSLQEGIVPQSWKSANVTPIYKKGPKSDCGNYRPVSLTSILCKLLESIIRDHLVKYIDANDLLSACQHGFVSGRSCSTQLIECLDTWMDLLDRGDSLDVVYLDFAKAFDSVPHERLLRKLRAFGINQQIIKWSESFLTGRKQRVLVNGSESAWVDVISGVPQGSVLGPLYFVLFINDMPQVVDNYIALFADDAKLFSVVGNDEDQKKLQEDIDKLQEWSNEWQLRFNAKKCKVMHLGRKNLTLKYNMGEVELEEITHEKDLGVMIDQELKFDIHVERQVNKANSQLGLIRRSFDALEPETFTMLFKSLVRTHLEYCNAVTYPIFAKQRILLEGVQRRATKLLPGLEDLPYPERLKRLKLPSLQYRRTRGDVIEVYKYVHNIYKVKELPVEIDDNPASTRGHCFKLRKPRCKKTATQKFFRHRVVDIWNRLPEDIVNAPTLNTMKNRLDEHWKKYLYATEPF